MILIKHFKNSFHVAKSLANNNLYELIRIFIVRFFYSIDKIRNFQKTIFKNQIIENNDLFKLKLNLNETLENLENYGFYDKVEITDSTIGLIKKQINNDSFITKLKLDKSKYFKNPTFESLDEISKFTDREKVKHLVLEYKDNKNKNIFTKLANSDYFKNVAKHYLNTDQIFCNISIFISNPHLYSEQEKKNYAQYFHYDCDYKKFFKVFIYLNDVDEETGPHTFLKYSHKEKKFSHILAERLSDEIIEKFYKKENVVKFIKKKGSVIIEDTFGLHKGETPAKNQRLMLIYEFGNCKPIYLDGDKNFFKI